MHSLQYNQLSDDKGCKKAASDPADSTSKTNPILCISAQTLASIDRLKLLLSQGDTDKILDLITLAEQSLTKLLLTEVVILRQNCFKRFFDLTAARDRRQSCKLTCKDVIDQLIGIFFDSHLTTERTQK
jgi:hypothetical protein